MESKMGRIEEIVLILFRNLILFKKIIAGNKLGAFQIVAQPSELWSVGTPTTAAENLSLAGVPTSQRQKK